MRLPTLLLCCLLLLTAAGCSGASEPGTDPGFVRGSDGSPADRVAAAAVTDVQGFWRATFGRTFGSAWRPLRGFRSVDTVSGGKACGDRLEGNAVYCASTDTVSWDRSALIPVLRHRFGDAAVVAVLAHEIGHAVQHRSGVEQGSAAYPAIVTEAMADCYSGAALRWLTAGHGAGLALGDHPADEAMRAIVTFRDPVGRAATAGTAHGDAFDRVAAFSDGYRSGAALCKGITAQNRRFTQQRFTDLDDATSGGDMPYRLLLDETAASLAGWLRQREHGFTAPALRTVPTACGGGQGPAGFCHGSIEVGSGLATLHRDLGDWAAGTMLAGRYALAFRAAAHRPTSGAAAREYALCFSGAYTATLLGRTGGFGLSPGDLDEAVQLLLRSPVASTDTAGSGIGSGIDRVFAFRAGVDGGLRHC